MSKAAAGAYVIIPIAVQISNRDVERISLYCVLGSVGSRSIGHCRDEQRSQHEEHQSYCPPAASMLTVSIHTYVHHGSSDFPTTLMHYRDVFF